jgi:hypothetical protein
MTPGWIDQTIRPPGEPEIEVNPVTNEIEVTWTLATPVEGRITLLVPASVAGKIAEKIGDVLPLMVPVLTVAMATIS